jgi:hypothetical protein
LPLEKIAMKKELWLAPFALSLAAAQSQPLLAQEVVPDIRAAQPDGKAATYVIFDLPDRGGNVIGVDALGSVVGTYDTSNLTRYGFYRLPDGTIHRFHPEPVAGLGPNTRTEAVTVNGVNADGTIVGNFPRIEGKEIIYTGFIRDRVGYTEVNAFDSINTDLWAINSAGVVAGSYQDPAHNFVHGFVRDAEGNLASFDAPGSNNYTSFQTIPTSINSKGDIVGYTQYPKDLLTAFLRDSNGDLTILEAGTKYPNYSGIFPVAITDDGLIIGEWQYNDGTGASQTYGFIRDLQGGYTSFNFPAASSTIAVAVDPQGSIIGNDESENQGFYRLRDGTFGSVIPPGAVISYVTAIGRQGDIAGSFLDAAQNGHNFIRINPDPPATSTAQNENLTAEPAQ